MRGKGRVKGVDRDLNGITPACAGKRIGETEMYVHDEDHPRVCGEKGRTIGTSRTGIGSPPRVRGKVNRRPAFRITGGITPACAGKRAFRALVNGAIRDHPRVCGEKTKESLKK